MKKIAIVATAALISLVGLSSANAQDTGHTYALDDGSVHANPGEMFAHLRTRTNGLATGNPKEIVEHYDDAYENVGDLVGQSRERGAETANDDAAVTDDGAVVDTTAGEETAVE